MQVNLVTVLLFLQLIFIVTLKKAYQMQQKKKNFFSLYKHQILRLAL